MTCIYTYKGNNYSFTEINEILSSDPRLSPLPEKTSVSENISGLATSLKEKTRISKKIQSSVQDEIVNSLAYALVTNTKDDDVSNKDRVKVDLKIRYKNFLDVIDVYPVEHQNSPAYKNVVFASKTLAEVLNNFDKFIEFAEDKIRKIGFSETTDSYYDNMEEGFASDDVEDAGVVHFLSDDRNRTTDLKEFIPASVKKLMFFLPEYRLLNPSIASDQRLINKGETYTTVNNSIGLPSFNNFNDTWSKVLSVLSAHYFDSTAQGLNDMISVMEDSNSPYIVQQLAKKLRLADNQTKIAFFVKTNLQLQDNISIFTEFEGGAKTDKIFSSMSTSGTRKIFNDLKAEFLATPNIIRVVTDPKTGKEIKEVNTEFGKTLLEKAETLYSDPNSYVINNRGKATSSFTEPALNSFYQIFKDAGINISSGAFIDYVQKNSRHQNRNVNDLITNLLRRLSGDIDPTKTDPFTSERSTLNTLSNYEFKYRDFKQADSYRQGGKSYYPFIKKSFLSDIYAKIKKSLNSINDRLTKKNTFIGQILSNDIFGKHSTLLKSLYNGSPQYQDLFNTSYELGTKVDTSDTPRKLLKDMSVAEHLLVKYTLFQNAGNKNARFLFDTLSDKTTMILPQLDKTNILFTGNLDDGTLRLDDNTLDTLYGYFQAEYDRILLVQKQNEDLPTSEKLEGYHDIRNSEGFGKRFLIYHFLNKEMLNLESDTNPRVKALYNLLYPSGELTGDLNKPVVDAIKTRINNHFVQLIQNNKKTLYDEGVISNTITPSGQITKIDTSNLFNKNYKNKTQKELGITQIGVEETNRLVDQLVTEFVVGYARKSVELLYLTGDPAQAAKNINEGAKQAIKQQYLNNPKVASSKILMEGIKNSLVNLSKRNASMLASGELGNFDNINYRSCFANDIKIFSDHIEEYLALFPNKTGLVKKSYTNGDLTDAQELTTVKEFLTVKKAFGKINNEEYKLGLYHYDRDQYNIDFKNQPIPRGDINKIALILQPDKPVQRLSTIDADLSINKQYYIKTSSFPLLPSLVKGTPWEEVLNGMKANNVDRLAFKSGVKQGVTGSKDLFNKEGQFNSNFFNDNVHLLDRNGFRIQLEVPYHEDKTSIREGSQQSKMLFVDIDDNLNMYLPNSTTPIKAKELKKNYVDYHQEIVNLKREQLIKDLEIQKQPDGSYKINNLSKLSETLIKEGLDRDYGVNSLMGLDLNEKGGFKIPLTFLLNSGRIEPVITAILSNRIARMKLPGYSYIQGTGAVLHTGKIKTGDNLEEIEDVRDIIWTKPEYAGLSKLQYLRNSDNPNRSGLAQLLMSPYIVVNGQRIDLREKGVDREFKYLTRTDKGNLIVDRDIIDPSLLEMNGFRIPFQGHNSGMWFEIVGFLPPSSGDLILVPGEIAAQMGSDYDVDKLYAYMYNYYFDGDNIKKITDNTELAEINRNNENNYNFVKEEFQRRFKEVNSEINQNKLLNSLFGEFQEQLTTDENILKNELFNKILKEQGLTQSDLRSISEQELSIKKAQNSIIDIHQAVYTNPELKEAILNPLAFDDFNKAITDTQQYNPEQSEFFGGIFDPNYQMDLYFSNSDGKLGVAISALANTFHAMAQTANLFIKGEGVKISLTESSPILSDYISGTDTNRTTALDKNTYSYEVGNPKSSNYDEATRTTNNNSQTNESAWRLDKIYTFPDKDGNTYKISDLISQVLGVSVDNAKEQLLGKFGINKHNFNTALLLIQLGFDLTTVKKFITQPILKEYYAMLDQLSNMYNQDFTPDKKNFYTNELFKKYNLEYLLNRPEVDSTSVEFMENSLLEGSVSDNNKLGQLSLLKSFISYSKIADDIQLINRALNTDTKGLGKNIMEVLNQKEAIEQLSNNQIGNIDLLKQTSIPGTLIELPQFASEIFTNNTDPLFAYNSFSYRGIKGSILELSGKDNFYREQEDIIHNNIKQFIYSGFNYGEPVTQLRERLLFDTKDNKSLSTRLTELLDKYSKNSLLRSIEKVSTEFVNDPKILSIPMSDESNFINKISNEWESMLESQDEQLKSFGEDLIKYALSTANLEFGNSNLIKYIPFDQLESLGFTDYLTNIHSSLNNIQSPIQDFITEQIIQHNPDFLKSVKDNMIVPKTKVLDDNGIIISFTLSDPDNTKAKSFALSKLSQEGRYYPLYLSHFNKITKSKSIYKNDGTNRYNIIPKLGSLITSEYNFNAVQAQSIFESNKVPNVLISDSSSIVDRSVTEDTLQESYPISAKEVIETADSMSSLLSGLDSFLQGYISDTQSDPKQANVAQYYKELISKLSQINNLEVSLIVDNNLKANGATTSDGTKIYINPSRIIKDKRAGLTPNLNLVRVVLHELIHSVTNKQILQGKSLEEVENVWNEYRKLIWDSNKTNKIRNIPLNVFDAELTKALISRFGLKEDQLKELNITNIRSKFAESTESQEDLDNMLTNLLEEVGYSLNELVQQGKIPDANYDTTDSPSRVKDFKDYIQDKFLPNLESMIDKYYGYYNIKEFMTEATTNPETMDYIKEAPSLIQKVKDLLLKLINNILGLKEDSERTLLNDAIESVLEYIKSSDLQDIPGDGVEITKVNNIIEPSENTSSLNQSTYDNAILERIKIQNQIDEVSQRLDLINQQKEYVTQSDPYIYIANNLPKITPESAKKETGTNIGTNSDINPRLLSKRGVSVERASELIKEELFQQTGQDLEESEIRDEIIDILQVGIKGYINNRNLSGEEQSLMNELSKLDNSLTEINKVIADNYIVPNLGDNLSQGSLFDLNIFNINQNKVSLPEENISKLLTEDINNLTTANFKCK